MDDNILVYSQIEQGSLEWFDLKRGMFSASRVVDLCKGTRGAYTAARKNYIAKVVVEIMTGKTAETYTSPAMARGVELEAEARQAYEAKTGEWADQVPFVKHPSIARFGASPDGLVGKDGGLEIKCPEAAQHLDTLINGTVKRDYIYQMQAGMMCTGREWWDFVSYNPDFPEHLQLYVCRYEYDVQICNEIATEVFTAGVEVKEMLKKLGV